MSSTTIVQHSTPELRFGFGKNWQRFLKSLNEERIKKAEESLIGYLGVNDLKKMKFLDVGSGSGLFSLAARRLGATVHSFDYDAESVSCTQYLKQKFFPKDPHWKIEKGSILDPDYLSQLGQFDIVYSWGVLHHTGDLWNALRNVEMLVKPKGHLFISIYNDQGGASRRWKYIKMLYNKSGFLIRTILLIYTLIRQWTLTIISDTLKQGNPLKSWFSYSQNRGMSAWYDIVDWVGGYPFEVAKPEEIFSFFHQQGYQLKKLKTCAGGLGCNEFLFLKESD